MVLIGNLNINSIRNKFDQLKDTVLKYIDILILTGTKLDETFLISQSLMDGFSNWDTIPSKILEKHSCPNNIEYLFIELNFRKCKWLLYRTYHPPSQNDKYYFNYHDKALDSYSNYEKVLLVGDFNTNNSISYNHSSMNMN